MFIEIITNLLKKRLILHIVFSIFFICSIHGFMFLDMDSRADSILNYVLDENVQNKSINIDSLPLIGHTNFNNNLYPARYFCAIYNKQGNLISLNLNHFPEMSYSFAENLISNFNLNESLSGYYGLFKYKGFVNDSGIFIICLDQSINLYSIFISLTVSTVLFTIFIIFSIFTGKKNEKYTSNLMINENFANIPKIHFSDSKQSNKKYDKTKEKICDEISIFNENNMNKIVGQLLLLSNLKIKNWLKPFEKFNFSDMLLEVAFSFQTIEETKKKQIEVNIQRNIFIEGNKKYLKKCVELLVDNSIKYSDDFGNIIICLESNFNGTRFSIKNTCNLNVLGNLDLLFQPFYRRSCNFSENGCNFGMGLAVVKKIVEAHNAQIFVKSEENFVDFFIVFPNQK